MILSGTAVLSGTIEITAKRSAYATDPGADSNTLTVTVVAPPTPATIASTSALALGAVNPSINVDVTNTQVSYLTVTAANFAVNVGTTGLTFTSASYGGGVRAILNFTGTVQAGTLTVAADDTILNPATGGRTNTVSFTAAPRPTIASTSSIANAAVNPTVTVTGSNFAAGITDDSLTVSTGSTGLTYASVTYVSASELTVAFAGTAAAGQINMTAKPTAYSPVDTLDSNTLTFTVASPPPTGDVIATGNSSATTLNPASVSTAVSSTFSIANQGTGSLSVIGASGSIKRPGFPSSCAQLSPCLVNPQQAVTFEVVTQGTVTVGSATLTIGSGPGPGPNPGPPVFPPSGPTEAKAEAGDGSATVTWGSPASQGSFPVSHYQVQTTPSSSGCLVPAAVTSCTLAGLRNGTAYAVQVRALNGAGWGAWADAGSVTPRATAKPSIVISGSRSDDGRLVLVRGSATELDGETLQSWLRLGGDVSFRAGSTRVVGAEGAFEWQRATRKKVTLYFATTDGTVRSNVVTVPAR